MYEAVVKNVSFLDREGTYHIGIRNERIAAIEKRGIQGVKEWDAQGDIILPPFVEMHTHLDTALTVGGHLENKTGTLNEAIQIWQERKKELTIEDVRERAEKVLSLLVQSGVLHVRAAVDISDPNLTALKALIGVRNSMQKVIDLQIIAFPQDGIISCPANQDRLIEAIQLGADAVSAVPHLEYTREKGIHSLQYCFSIAKKYGTDIHIFCDETDDASSRFLEVVAALTLEHNMGDRVTASHVNSLAYAADSYASKVIPLVRKAGVNIVSCPLVNCAMQARYDNYPKGRGITRMKELNDAGVNVCIAHDDIQTPFYPFGNGNILQAANMAAHLAHMTGSNDLLEILNMITYNGAKAFGIHPMYGVEIGKKANFIILPAKRLSELLTNHPKCRYVFRDGRLIAATEPAKTHLCYDHLVVQPVD